MAFIMWIENCILSPEGYGNLFGWILLSENVNPNLQGTLHQGSMLSIDTNGKTHTFAATLAGCHSYQNGWGWYCSNITTDISRSIVTDQPEFFKVFSGKAEILVSQERLVRFPKRGNLTLPVGSVDGWIGVLDYKSTGYFRQKINWTLHAFSPSPTTSIHPGPLFQPQKGWFPIRPEFSIPFGTMKSIQTLQKSSSGAGPSRAPRGRRS